MTEWCLCTPSSTSPPCSTSSAAAPSRRTLCSSSWTQSQVTAPASPPARSSRRWPTPTPLSLAVSTSPGSNNLLLALNGVCVCLRGCVCMIFVFFFSNFLKSPTVHTFFLTLHKDLEDLLTRVYTATVTIFCLFVCLFSSPSLSPCTQYISQHAALTANVPSPLQAMFFTPNELND